MAKQAKQPPRKVAVKGKGKPLPKPPRGKVVCKLCRIFYSSKVFRCPGCTALREAGS